MRKATTGNVHLSSTQADQRPRQRRCRGAPSCESARLAQIRICSPARSGARRGAASLVESPIDFYKSQMQKQLILARAVRAAPAPHPATVTRVPPRRPAARARPPGAGRTCAPPDRRPVTACATALHAPSAGPQLQAAVLLDGRLRPTVVPLQRDRRALPGAPAGAAAFSRELRGPPSRFGGQLLTPRLPHTAQGLGATTLRNIPAAGVYFYTFEQMKARKSPPPTTPTSLRPSPRFITLPPPSHSTGPRTPRAAGDPRGLRGRREAPLAAPLRRRRHRWVHVLGVLLPARCHQVGHAGARTPPHTQRCEGVPRAPAGPCATDRAAERERPVPGLSARAQTDLMDKSKRNFSSFAATAQKMLAEGARARRAWPRLAHCAPPRRPKPARDAA